jgi:hypothetical protein
MFFPIKNKKSRGIDRMMAYVGHSLANVGKQGT